MRKNGVVFRILVFALGLGAGGLAQVSMAFPWAYIHTVGGIEVVSERQAKGDYEQAIGAAALSTASSPWEKDVCGDPGKFGYSETEADVDRYFTTTVDLTDKGYGVQLAMFVDDRATLSIFEYDAEGNLGSTPVHAFTVAGGAAWNTDSYKLDDFNLLPGKKYGLQLTYRNDMHWNDNRIEGFEDVDGISVYKVSIIKVESVEVRDKNHPSNSETTTGSITPDLYVGETASHNAVLEVVASVLPDTTETRSRVNWKIVGNDASPSSGNFGSSSTAEITIDESFFG
jgi:hypothetical protein